MQIIKQTLTALVAILALFTIEQVWLGSAAQSGIQSQSESFHGSTIVMAPYDGYQVRELRSAVAELDRKVSNLTPVSDQDSDY